jgi:hypothetical protein
MARAFHGFALLQRSGLIFSYWSRISSGLLTGPVARELASVFAAAVICSISFSVSDRAPLRVSTRLLSFNISFSFQVRVVSYESSFWSDEPLAVVVIITLRSVAPAPEVCSISS